MSADRSFPFSYSDAGTPAFYKCGTCGASGCKLWRYAATFSIDLECATCLGKRAGCTFDALGKTQWKVGDHVRNVMTECAGGCVPAVPAQDGGYWGTLVYPTTVALGGITCPLILPSNLSLPP